MNEGSTFIFQVSFPPLTAAIILGLSLELWSLISTGWGCAPRGPRLLCARSILMRLLVSGPTVRSNTVGSQGS